MKRIVAILISLLLMFVSPVAFADEMGVQIIGGPEAESEPVSLDDLQLNGTIVVDNFGEITPTQFQTIDALGSYRAGVHSIQDYYSSESDTAQYYSSGVEADYCIFRVDILNTQLRAIDYINDYTVVVTSDDIYQFAGWAYQYNYDNSSTSKGNRNIGIENANITYVIDPSDNFAIDPMYAGHYVFGCTLPNTIIESKTPLRMDITIGDVEMTYYIRK